MQCWDLELFELNNRTLVNYLNNIDNAIILLNANDMHAVQQLKNFLCDNYAFEGIDYTMCSDGVVPIIKGYVNQSRQNRICFYNMTENNIQYDLIKTMNLSRDLLRKVGIVVLIVPTFMVEQIQIENPNLYDYITLCLNYNLEYPELFKPIYSEENRFFLPKKILTARKNYLQTQDRNPSESIEGYYNYLESFRYVKMKENDADEVMDWLFFTVAENAQQQYGKINDIGGWIDMRMKLYKRTAECFVQQGIYQKAFDLYYEMCYMQEKQGESIYLLEGYQGMAFCLYSMNRYAEALDVLDKLLRLIDESFNLPWKYKVYHDYGVCLYSMGQYQEALKVWELCEYKLKEADEQLLHRHYRILYNKMLAYIKMKKSIKVYEQEWDTLERLLIDGIGKESLEYLMYLMLNSWLKLIQGKLHLAQNYAEYAYELGKSILPENDERLFQTSYILALVNLQLEKMKQSQLYENKCKNYLKNHDDLKRKYKDLFEEKS